jgi:hypothetical protein
MRHADPRTHFTHFLNSPFSFPRVQGHPRDERPKGDDNKLRPLGIPAFEDKALQRPVVIVPGDNWLPTLSENETAPQPVLQ